MPRLSQHNQKVVTFLSEQQLSQVKQEAANQDTSVSSFVRLAVLKALDHSPRRERFIGFEKL